MDSRTLLLLVEGPHDLEFCARLLKPRGFSRIKLHEELKSRHPFWLNLVPTGFPMHGDLLARHPVPVFFQNSEKPQSVAVVNADGVEKLASRLEFSLLALERPPDAVGIILDADSKGNPGKRFSELVEAVAANSSTESRRLSFPAIPGKVAAGPPRTGAFVMPDNQADGTLEDLLLEAGGMAYPQLLQSAGKFIENSSAVSDLKARDLQEFRKPAGRKKAIAAAMASILKPGKAIQVSIQDNRWLEGDALHLPRIAALSAFLNELLE